MRVVELRRTMLRVALAAFGLLLVPLVASRFVAGWNWPPAAFVFVYVLFFSAGMAYVLIARSMGVWSYKVGVALLLLTSLHLGWFDRVQVADSGHPANLLYYAVLPVGLAGVLLSRLRPTGLARTAFAMAAVTAVIALVLPWAAPSDLARTMAIAHSVYAVLFATSGSLFRHASRSPRP